MWKLLVAGTVIIVHLLKCLMVGCVGHTSAKLTDVHTEVCVLMRSRK